MDIHKTIAQLNQQRVNLDHAILSLERLAIGQPRRRGRPPKWLSQVAVTNGTAVEAQATGKPRRKRAVRTESSQTRRKS